MLDNVTFSIPPLSTIAFTGSEKSGFDCIPSLLSRLVDPTSGRIQIGDVEFRQANMYDIRQSITILPSQPYVFEASIAENINYGSTDSLHRPETLLEVKQAATSALLDDLLSTLPLGINTVITENDDNISLAQRQLICVARAIRQRSRLISKYQPIIRGSRSNPFCSSGRHHSSDGL